jgi:hypothetical protein
MGAENFALPSYEARQRCAAEISEQQLRKELTDAQLIDCIDLMAYGEGGWIRGPGDYQVELTRRETERQSKRLEWLTWALFLLTLALVALELLPRISGMEH